MTRAPDAAFYHWSPTDRRTGINRKGLVPGSPSIDKLWRPPYVCLSADPQLAYQLSIRHHPQVPSWDLWMVWRSSFDGYEEITDTYVDTGRTYVKEIRVYQRIYKRDVWLVATRIQGAR